MLTHINLVDNYLEVDLNVETVLKFRIDGDITSTVSENKIQYLGNGITITVNTAPLEWRFEIRTDSTLLDVSYVDFPEMPDILAELIAQYMDSRE